MKVSFELLRSRTVNPTSAITGAALRAPYPPDALRVRAQDIRDYQEFRHLAEKLNRSYDAASVDNFTADFKGTYGSANTEMLPAKYATRARSRTLAKDTSHGRGLMRTYADNVVGDDPFELEMEVGKFLPDGSFDEEKATNRGIEKAWLRFCRKENFTTRKTMDFMESMRVVEMSRAREGSVICREYPGYEFNEFGFAVDFLEEDRLQEQFMGQSGSDGRFGAGNPIRASIEYHPKYNFALAYWVLSRHPGEFFGQTPVWYDRKANNFREQVPADQIIHFNNLRQRAEQDIGMTELDATILPLWRIHQYDKSLTLSSIASASKPWWLEQKDPTGMEAPSDPAHIDRGYPAADSLAGAGAGSENPAESQQASGSPTNVIRPANRETLPPGFTLRQADPKFPIEAAHEFRLDNLRDISVATHGSYQQATGDYQNLGFIAGLMSQQAFQRNMRVRQKSLAEDLRRLFRDWLKSSIMTGYFDRNGVELSITRLEEYVDAAHFKGQQSEFVNPLVQAQALILLEEAHHMSRQDVQDALPNGKKVDKLFAQIAQEKKEEKEQGLDFDAELSTEPTINKEGDNAPGAPKPSGTEPGGNADIPPKSKAQSPRSRGGRVRGTIDSTTQSLLTQSLNGEH